MRAAVIQFPGSNCDRDMAVALNRFTTKKDPVKMVWHKESGLPGNLDLIAIPGGFSFGDYLRCGAIAARSPIMNAVIEFANNGGYVLGVCNGFQVLTESGLLPGALMRNSNLKFICKNIQLKVETQSSNFTSCYSKNEIINTPIAHHDGNYNADKDTIKELKDHDRIAFSYVDNPNGSMGNIAGILSENRRVLGMMPHPERLNDPMLGGIDGNRLFQSIYETLVAS